MYRWVGTGAGGQGGRGAGVGGGRRERENGRALLGCHDPNTAVQTPPNLLSRKDELENNMASAYIKIVDTLK